MKSNVDKINPSHVKITIKANIEELKPSFDKVYNDLSKQISVPGFRKGKIPKQIIKNRVGIKYIIDHAVNESLDSLYKKALKDNKIVPLSQPKVNIDAMPEPNKLDSELKCTFELDIRPDIKLPQYQDLKIEVDTVKVGKDEINNELKKLQTHFSSLKDVKRLPKDGDFVYIDISTSINDAQIDSKKDISYEVGLDSDSMFDGMNEKIKQLSIGEDATFTTHIRNGENAGKKAKINIVLRKVKERQLPSIDDSFANMSSEFDTVDDLKKDIEKKILQKKSAEQKLQACNSALDILLENTNIHIPENLINEKKKDIDKKDEVIKNISSQLLLDFLIEKENITVDQEEVIDHILTFSKNSGIEPSQLSQIFNNKNQISMIASDIAQRKVLLKIIQKMNIKDKDGNSVSIDNVDIAKSEEKSKN